jgi:protocatechuate 3,4-dioxygenase beta subunit
MNRRQLLTMAIAGPPAMAIARLVSAQSGAVRPTPACGAATIPQTEGPFFKASSPERQSLIEPSTRGTRIVIEGTVLTTDCQPAPGALIDIWHADAEGRYDNSGNRFRGHQFADDRGRFRIQTIVPGDYPGRTRHFHVKVQPHGGRVLTTQLYFADAPNNQRDGIFDPSLVMKIKDVEGGKLAAFDFVVQKPGA